MNQQPEKIRFPLAVEDAIIEDKEVNPVNVYFIEKSKWSGTYKPNPVERKVPQVMQRKTYVKNHDGIRVIDTAKAVGNLTVETTLLAVGIATFCAVLLRAFFTRLTEDINSQRSRIRTHDNNASLAEPKRDNINVTVNVNVTR